MNFNSSMATNVALVAVSAAAISSSNAQRRHDDAVETEFDSLARSLSKKKEFRAAATEMLGEIKEIAGLPKIAGPNDLKVRPGIFSLAAQDVPSDIKMTNDAKAKKKTGEYLDKIIEELKGDFPLIAEESLYEDNSDSTTVYEEFEAAEFLGEMDAEGLRALARSGVAIRVQDYMLQETEIGFFSGTSHVGRKNAGEDASLLERRALSELMEHYAVAVYDKIEEVREKDLEIIQAKSPAYVPD
jgi:hypothetical protein